MHRTLPRRGVSLVDKGNSEEVYVISSLGSRYPLGELGETTRVLSISNGQGVSLLGVNEGRETVVQQYTTKNGFEADIVVASDGSGDYERIQWGLDNASAGDTIVVKRATYTENVNITKSDIRLIAEHGTVIEDEHPNRDVIHIESGTTGVSVENFDVDGDPVAADGHFAKCGIYVGGNDATIWVLKPTSEATTGLLMLPNLRLSGMSVRTL
jgi:hypothetical protein